MRKGRSRGKALQVENNEDDREKDEEEGHERGS